MVANFMNCVNTKKNMLHTCFMAQSYYSVDYEKCKHCFLYSDLYFRQRVFPSRLFAPLVIESKAKTVEEKKKTAKNQTRYIFYVLFELIQVALQMTLGEFSQFIFTLQRMIRRSSGRDTCMVNE